MEQSSDEQELEIKLRDMIGQSKSIEEELCKLGMNKGPFDMDTSLKGYIQSMGQELGLLFNSDGEKAMIKEVFEVVRDLQNHVSDFEV